MKLELKGIKHSEFASEETNCYTATLYVDGKRFATVGNEGHGGCDFVRKLDISMTGEQFRTKLAAVNKWLAENNPPVELSGGSTLSYDLELWCDNELEIFLVARKVTRLVKSKIVCVDGNRCFTINNTPTEALFTKVRAKYPTAAILNTIPVREAAKLLLKTSE